MELLVFLIGAVITVSSAVIEIFSVWHIASYLMNNQVSFSEGIPMQIYDVLAQSSFALAGIVIGAMLLAGSLTAMLINTRVNNGRRHHRRIRTSRYP